MDDDLLSIEFAFPGALRDSLIAAVRSGSKTSSSSLLREYEVGSEVLPTVGYRGVVLDSNGEHVFVVETTAVEIVRLGDVRLGHAVSEGEGYLSVAEWRAGHTEFWSSDVMRAELGSDFTLDDDSLVVLEQFVLVG